jgi:hypothetical protein
VGFRIHWGLGGVGEYSGLGFRDELGEGKSTREKATAPEDSRRRSSSSIGQQQHQEMSNEQQQQKIPRAA